MSKTILITGAPGQDATVLTHQLIQEGHRVICTYRYSSVDFSHRFKHFPVGSPLFTPVCCDITDSSGCTELVQRYDPDEIYNLAAQSHVHESFKNPAAVFEINTKPVIYFLEAIRRLSPQTRFLQASTSEMFGSNYSVSDEGVPVQDENTPLAGNSPYAVSKIAAHNMVRLYRESYGLFACSSICFNHEGIYRGENFITRKVSKWVGHYMAWCEKYKLPPDGPAKFTQEYIVFKNGQLYPKLKLGNLNAVRDWSSAEDLTRGMQLMLAADYPNDFVLCSGQGRNIRQLLEAAFHYIDVDNFHLDLYVQQDPTLCRPCEVPFLQGSAAKAKRLLGWEPRISFHQLIQEMVANDYQLSKKC